MLSLKQLPTRPKSLKKLAIADDYFSQQWLLDISYVNKTILNKRFGRTFTNIALARYFNVGTRGSNVSRKLTEVQARDLDCLPEGRQAWLLKSAVEQNVEVTITEILPDPPTEFDTKSMICIMKENLDEAVSWCINNKKFQYIKPVRIIMSRLFWTVYYKKKTNRFYAIWPFCLTNWPGKLRKLILSGADYDLHNAIGQFILEKVGVELQNYPEVLNYLNTPNVKRQELVDALGITPTQAKKVLHATVNGAAITSSSIFGKNSSLLEIINETQALEYVVIFKSLCEQLKQVRKKIAPNNKQFMGEYFKWEEQKTGTFFSGTGLIMHDGLDGCSLSTVIPAQFSTDIKISESRGVWDEDSIINTLIKM